MESLHDLGMYIRESGFGARLSAPVASLWRSKTIARLKPLLEDILVAAEVTTLADLFHAKVDRRAAARFGQKQWRQMVEEFDDWFHSEDADEVMSAALPDDDRDDDEDAHDDFDLFSENELLTASAETHDQTPPPTDREALHLWAKERGVFAHLSSPAPGLPSFPHELTATTPATFEDVLTRPLPSAQGAGAKRARKPDLQASLWELRRSTALVSLMRFVENIAHLRQRRRKLDESKRPLDPALTAFAEVVDRTRTALASTVPPRLAGEALPAPLRFADLPARIEYDEASSPRDSLMSGYREPNLVEISLSGWEQGGLAVTCRCRSPHAGCPHRAAALAELAELLQQPAAHAYAPLRGFVSTPAWTRALERFDHAIAKLTPPAKNERLAWRVRSVYKRTSVEPIIQKLNAQGVWSRGSQIPVSHLGYRNKSLTDPVDVQVADILTGGRGPSHYGESPPAMVFHALQALAGAANVFLADRRDVPVAIRTLAPRLELTERRAISESDSQTGPVTNELLLRVRMGEALLTPADVAERMQERYFIDIDDTRNECRLAAIDHDLAAVLQTFAAEDVAFPDGVLTDLLARFERLAPQSRVELPQRLRGTQVPADERLLCRLTPVGDRELRIDVLVRPLPGAGETPPGEGPPVVVVTRPEGRVHCVRDLAREGQIATTLATELHLADVVTTRAHRYEITELERAADVVAGLGERADRVVVEWPADAWKITRATARQLKLVVDERRDWFGLNGGLEVDGQMIPIAALLEAIRRGQRYVVLGPRRFAAIEEELRRRLAALAEVTFEARGVVELGAPAIEPLSALVEDQAQLEAIPSFVKVRARLLEAAALDPVIPPGFRADLRPYQREGYRWLMRLAEAGAGACLADDMGLGKTVQLLAVLQARAAKGPALVVAPTSVVANWLGEAQRFAPNLRPVLYRGPDRAQTLAGVGPGDLVVTSYGIAVLDVEALSAVPFAALVLDEAQAIKNAATHRARAIRKLNAAWRVALSGTPIENHLGELWSLYRIVSPALFGSWEQFRERFAIPIERFADRSRRAALARVLTPFLLRRTKEAVAPELPPKTQIERLIELGPGERRLYEATRLAALASLERRGDRTDPEEAQRRIEVLAALTRLRQLACHPKLGDDQTQETSSKLATLVELLSELQEAGHRALVFSQFARFLDLARGILAEAGITHLHLDGSTPPSEREARIEAFQRGEATAFLISLRAGGTGLNLTAADYVIHLDPWWNPAVEDQATDRAHRIGQKKSVTVVRLVARGTIEEMVRSLHDSKRGLAASVLEGSDAVARLDTDALVDLLRSSHADAGVEPVELQAEIDAEAGAESSGDETTPGDDDESDAAINRPQAVDLGGLDQLFELVLAPFAGRDTSRLSPTYKSYQRSLHDFRRWLREGNANLDAGLDACAEEFLSALKSGAWPAPKSAYGIARVTLGHLRRVAAAAANAGRASAGARILSATSRTA